MSITADQHTPRFPAFPFYEGPYNPAVCPPTRSTHGVEHTCAPSDRDTCPAPESWDDHCHVYGWFLAVRPLQDARDAAQVRLDAAESAAELAVTSDDIAAAQEVVAAARAERDAANQAASPLWNDLVTYYLPRAEEMRQRKLEVYPLEEGRAMALEALLSVLRRYDPAFGVPVQAYLRSRMPHRLIDVQRSEGPMNRREATFERRLKTAMNAMPGVSERAAARSLIGTVSSGTRVYSAADIDDLMAERASRRATYFDDLVDEEGSSDVLDRLLVDPEDTLDLVIAAESAENAARVVTELTAGLASEDIELVFAYVARGEAVQKWADAHGMTRAQASARAQSVLSKMQTRAAGMLNVSKAKLVARKFERNEEKFLEVLHTGRLTPVLDGDGGQSRPDPVAAVFAEQADLAQVLAEQPTLFDDADLFT